VAPPKGCNVQSGTAGIVESFLYREAELLDDLRFEEWFSLFAEGATYFIPSTDVPHGDPRRDLFIVNDDYARLQGRVKRLQSRDAHADYPHPRTRRLITNVRVDESAEVLVARSNFLICAFRVRKRLDFVGEYTHHLLPTDNSLRITSRRADLDLESLGQAGGKINIIV
jgi:p-cumate 2,3-dioxygenase beta subunit